MFYAFLFDQFLVILVGVGVGLLLNLYMPSLDKPLKEKQERLEQNFQVILYEIALYINDKNEKWDGKELTESEEILQEALERSEEHTSELQSRGHLVCRLLLEKKEQHHQGMSEKYI